MIAYFCLVIPYRLGFIYNLPTGFILYEFIFDMYLLVFTVSNFFKAYYKDIVVVDSYPRISRKYLKSFFIIDFIPCFPFYLITNHLYWLKAPRVLRGSFVFHNFRLLFTSATGSKEKAAEWYKLMIAVQVLEFLWKFVLVIHFLACMWIYIQAIEPAAPIYWIPSNVNGNFDEYVTSLYWIAVTLATVGYGDISPKTNSEIIFTMFVEMQGIVFFAYLMGKVTTLAAEYSRRNESSFQEEGDLNKWLLLMSTKDDKILIPHTFNNKVIEFYTFLVENQNLIQDSEFLMRMPHTLRSKILKNILEHEKLRFEVYFEDSNNHFLYKMILKMKPIQVEEKNYVVLGIGSAEKSLFFVSSGKIIVTGDKEQGYLILQYQSYFGEELIIFQEDPTVNYVTGSRVELFYVTEDDYTDTINSFPDELARARTRSYIRREYLERVGEIYKKQDELSLTQISGMIASLTNEFNFYSALSEAEKAHLQELVKKSEASQSKKKSSLDEVSLKYAEIDSRLNLLVQKLA
jgi:Ion transport protein